MYKQMGKQDLFKTQSCVLKVNIHCDGCRKKVKKLLQKIDGVYDVNINAEQGRVTVTGNVDPNTLIKKLEKGGKHAEIWGGQRAPNNYQDFMNAQFRNMQIENGKSNKNQKGVNGKEQHQKGSHQLQQQQQQKQQMKGSKDMKVPPKEQKSVKFNMDEFDDEMSGDDFDDDFDDEDGFDDEYDVDDDDDDMFDLDHHQHHPSKMMMPPKGNSTKPNGSNGMIKGHGLNDKNKGNGGEKKKGGFFNLPIKVKGFGGKSSDKDNKKDKKGKDDKKLGGNGKTKNGEGKNGKGGTKCEGKNGGKFLVDNKNNKNGSNVGGGGYKGINNSNAGNGGGVHNNGNLGRKWSQPISNNMKDGFEIDVTSFGPNVPNGRNVMGGHNHMGNYQMGHGHNMGNFPAVQGLPATAMNGGFYGGVGAGNPYNQQYMAMMMNQQRGYGNEGFQPMMYARPQPPPPYGYMPPMPPQSVVDPYMFNDENTSSCSIM
ncbi:Heavy metal-associated domain, HMA [Dillenia turbinata]|uniref:Heavy metal-associated domain, HMA n=1 Tax=Dillenia turbinata TaxID=194707 RepID=A0AAN8UT95_9MAGN